MRTEKDIINSLGLTRSEMIREISKMIENFDYKEVVLYYELMIRMGGMLK